MFLLFFFFFKQKTAYEMRISDWSSDVCSSDLADVTKAFVAALISLTLSATAISPALAKDKSSAEKAKQRGVAEIPICTKRLGTVAIVEPDNHWRQALNLGSPEAITTLFVMNSGRWEERRVGKECDSTCRYRWSSNN